MRIIAVDWSGAASPSAQRRHIVAADWSADAITLSSERTREETISWLIAQASQTSSLVVGLDFAFSYPAWFIEQQGAETVEDFWHIVAVRRESWLASCQAPFWGRPARRCPADHRSPHWRGYRVADRLEAKQRQPSSPFQIGGAGAVGTGSIRGIPSLLRLHAAGFSIWPFHPPEFPMVMEIYPRSFTGPVNKSNRDARIKYLDLHAREAGLDQASRPMSIESEDAFDALCSVIGMARQREEIARLQQAIDQTTLLEGAIFPGLPIASGRTIARKKTE